MVAVAYAELCKYVSIPYLHFAQYHAISGLVTPIQICTVNTNSVQLNVSLENPFDVEVDLNRKQCSQSRNKINRRKTLNFYHGKGYETVDSVPES